MRLGMFSKNLITNKIKIYPYDIEISDNDPSSILPKPIEQIEVPLDPQLFYKDFGYLLHPKTGKDVEQLTDYQYRIWNSKTKYRVVIKSQKVGVSTSALLEDFQ